MSVGVKLDAAVAPDAAVAASAGSRPDRPATGAVGLTAAGDSERAVLGGPLARAGYRLSELELGDVLAARALPVGLAAVVVAIERADLRRGAAIRALRQIDAEVPIVVVSDGAWRQVVRDAIAAGADAYVDRAHAATDLAIAVAAASAGHVCVPRTVRRSVVPAALSFRERQILGRVCRGLTNRQIARELFLSENTVKSHLTSGFRKLGVASRSEAIAALAASRGEGARWSS